MPPHTRLALSVIERAVKDIKYDDASLYRKRGQVSEWVRGLLLLGQGARQDSDWLLRALHVRLRTDSPQAYERLAPVGGSRSRTAGWERHQQVLSGELANK